MIEKKQKKRKQIKKNERAFFLSQIHGCEYVEEEKD